MPETSNWHGGIYPPLDRSLIGCSDVRCSMFIDLSGAKIN